MKQQNATLRARNRELAEHLDLAIAEIQRLALESHQLRTELAARSHVARFTP
ncbi:hypothetical protein [Amycolatopsis sp. NPDC098790]|uniref:hypothetical protein n=1 Tax=Amycolatopsis sp. NPDC098790 TaxID=3363939 RepID=UPI0038141E1D